ncbi:carboxypeptidase-like protein [Salegentibacter sp. 24]|nr:carboxypeptidase-like protein [Salegentibacter sp. 24]
MCSLLGYSQSTISGEILDEKGENLSGATVIVSKDTTGTILAYGISNGKGEFKVNLKLEIDSLFLKVSYIGYSTWEQKIQNTDQQLEIALSPSSEALKEVLVETKIIDQQGDTISYSVAAFKDQKDRVIADVLKKMPGIEILPGGQIEYQGQPIQKYYIEGLDLLEGRYSLANNNISADDVSKVQILENHQPVKLLDSLEFSERASLNIKLKKDVTVSGSAELGTGFSPLLWKAKVTPMIFTKKNQAIVTYQANNTGREVSREIRDFSISDFGREEFNSSKSDWLSIGQLARPPFAQERWLDNNVHLGSANYLIRLEKEVDLKTNISYLNDAQHQIGKSQTRFFTPTDTIELVENTHNDLFINTLQTNFIFEKNTDDNYLKNELEISGFWDSQRGNIDTGNSRIHQRLSNPFSVIRNKLRLLKPVGKQLVTFRSNTGYTEANQNLQVQPGQYEALLNNGINYAEMEQAVKATTFFSDNTAGFTKKIKAITISPEVGVSVKNQSLGSRLRIFDQNETQILDGDFQNNLDFLTSRFYTTSRFVYENNYWNIRLTTPLNLRSFTIEDTSLNKSQSLDRLTFEPSFYIKNKFSAFWETSISANFSNNFGDLDQVYFGFILNNYRNLQRYNSPLPEIFNQNYSWQLRFRNPLKSLFANLSYSFGKTKRNLIYSNRIGENAATIFEALEKENYTDAHRLGIKASKYFSKLNTTLSLGSSFIISNREQLLNDNLVDVENQNLAFKFDLESEVTHWLSASYSGNLSFLKTSLEAREFNEIRTQQHELDLFFYLADNQYFSVDSEYYFNNISKANRNNYFLNVNYQYTFKDSGIDLKASWNNVLNTDEFVRVFNTDFSYVQSTYRLRPSQVLVSMKFSF